MLQNSLSKILSTISLSTLSIALLSGALSSSSKAMDMDPFELKARKLAGKTLDEINNKSARLYQKAEIDTERKGYILGRIEILSTLAQAIQQPDDADGLKNTMLLSAAQDYYKEKYSEEAHLPKPKTFKPENASLSEIETEISRLTTSIASLSEIQKECISPQIGALKAYRILKFDNNSQSLLHDALNSYYAATAALKELEKTQENNTVTFKVNENEKEKTVSTVSVAPKAPNRIGLIDFFSDGLEMEDEYTDEAKNVWTLVGCDKLGTTLKDHKPTTNNEQWYFEPTQPLVIKEKLSLFQELLALEPQLANSDAYAVRFTLYNPTSTERKNNCHFFMVLKK